MKFQQVSNHNFYSNIIRPQYFLIFVTVTEILKDVFKKLKEIPEENKALHAKIDKKSHRHNSEETSERKFRISDWA